MICITSSNSNRFSDFHFANTMINSLAISIVFTSLLAAQVWSAQNQKEGHSDVVEESYDRNGRPITKVSFSPPPPHDPISAVDGKFPTGLVDNSKDIIKKGVSSVFVDTPKFIDGGEGYSAGELISDAIDKGPCKNVMSDAITKVEDAYGKAKEKATGTAHSTKEVAENAYETATEKASEKVHGAKEVVQEAVEKATEKATDTTHGAKEALQKTYGKATEKASETTHGAKEALQNTYGKASEKATETVHGAKELLEKAYEKATDMKAKDTAQGAKEVVGDAIGKTWKIASEKSQGAREAANEATEAVDVAYKRTKNLAAHKAHDVKGSTLESLKQVKDTGKTLGVDTAINVSLQLGKLKHFSGSVARSIFRGVNEGFRYLISGQWLDTLFGVINLLGFAIAYGMGMWVTFISRHVLAGALPRHQLGVVQSKIYAVYFRAMGLSIVMALLGHSKSLFSGTKAGWLQVYNLLASLLADLVNAFYLEPLATKVMLEKFRLEKEEGRGREIQGQERSGEEVSGIVETAMAEAEQREMRERMGIMNERLKRLNSYSAFLNILTLMGLSWHLVHLGRGFHLTT